MFQLVPILALAILSALGATGYIVVQQNKQIESLSNQVKTLQTSSIPTPTFTITPTPDPTPTKKPVIYTSPTYAPGMAPAIEPQGKQKALIEVENQMASLKQQIQKYLADYDRLKNTPYADIPLDAANNLSKQYQELEKQRWQIMSQQ